MTEKEIAEKIVDKIVLGKRQFIELKEAIEKFLNWILSSIKEISNEIPDEDKFLKVLSHVTDNFLKLPAPYEWFDDKVAHVLLTLLDKTILDKFLGKNWYDNLKQKLI